MASKEGGGKLSTVAKNNKAGPSGAVNLSFCREKTSRRLKQSQKKTESPIDIMTFRSQTTKMNKNALRPPVNFISSRLDPGKLSP